MKFFSKSGLVGIGMVVSGLIPLTVAYAQPVIERAAVLAAEPVKAQESGVMVPIWALSMLVPFVMAIVGWLLKRSLDAIDTKLVSLDAGLKKSEAAHTELRVDHTAVKGQVEGLLLIEERRNGQRHNTPSPP